jgi:hypothetical protein
MPRPLLIAACASCFASFASAQRFYDVADARAYGLANAFSASARGTQALYANPATLSCDERFEASLSGAWNFAEGASQFLGLGISKSGMGAVAAAFGYHLVGVGSWQERSMAHLVMLAVAMSIDETFHIGISGRQHLVFGPQNMYPFNFSLGVGINSITDTLSFFFSVHNLLKTPVDDPSGFVLSAALKGNYYLAATLETGLHFNNDRKVFFALGGSLEVFFSSFSRGLFLARAGCAYDQVLGGAVLGLGVGVSMPNRTNYSTSPTTQVKRGGELSLGYRHVFGNPKNHVLALTGAFNL